MRNKSKPVLIGLAVAVLFFLSIGIPTAMIPTGLFARMLEVTLLDYLFLVLVSGLIGSYVGLHLYRKRVNVNKQDYAATGGGIVGILAVSCPICNVFLVSLLGASFIMLYIEPSRPILGLIAVAVLGSLVYLKARNLRRCSKC